MISPVLSEQLIQIGSMMIAGIAALIFFDILREVGRFAKWSKYQYIIAEFIIVVLLGLCFCTFLIVRYHGVLRMYILFALLLGAIGYYNLLRPYNLGVCRAIAKVILWLYVKITGILLFPWKLFHRHVLKRAKKKVQQVRQRRQKAKLAALEEQEFLEEII